MNCGSRVLSVTSLDQLNYYGKVNYLTANMFFSTVPIPPIVFRHAPLTCL